MAITHALASGLGGVRTAGDLVARMQMSRGLKTEAAKKYVAEKLGVGVIDLVNEEVMTEVRRELDLGLVYSLPGYARGLEAKRNIARVLEIPINCIRQNAKEIEMVRPPCNQPSGETLEVSTFDGRVQQNKERSAREMNMVEGVGLQFLST